jgi:hypothetical protein
MTTPTSRIGRQLHALLPELYRSRDADGDLTGYLDAFGALLDALRNTLDQRLADAFPDAEPTPQGRVCQEWVIPYLAQLVDARPVSPLADGRREEVARAIRWRQGKGTLPTIEDLVQVVSGLEAELQEGWKRVAVTPRVDLALVPQPGLDLGDPLEAARHPELPAVTADLRHYSRAVAADRGAPGARQRRLPDGSVVTWLPSNPRGAPCFPASHQDWSRRTADLRDPDWRHGHAHPRRLLVYLPPPAGFFAADLAGPPADLILAGDQLLEDRIVSGTLRVTGGRLRLARCAVGRVEVDPPPGPEPALVAEDCLFGEVGVPGLVRLLAVTVLGALQAQRLEASDSLFAGTVATPPDAGDCLRFSRVPPAQLAAAGVGCTGEAPVFFAPSFGRRGCGVLHPACPAAIRAGAEDGGELGAYHHRAHALKDQAVLDKLADYLPLGLAPALVYDDQLVCAPPTLITA